MHNILACHHISSQHVQYRFLLNLKHSDTVSCNRPYHPGHITQLHKSLKLHRSPFLTFNSKIVLITAYMHVLDNCIKFFGAEVMQLTSLVSTPNTCHHYFNKLSFFKVSLIPDAHFIFQSFITLKFLPTSNIFLYYGLFFVAATGIVVFVSSEAKGSIYILITVTS